MIFIISVLVSMSGISSSEIIREFSNIRPEKIVISGKSSDSLSSSEKAEKMEQPFFETVAKMELLLAKNKCQDCLSAYLKAMTLYENSANEEFTDSLAKMIVQHPKLVDSACMKQPADVRKKLQLFFPLAIAGAGYQSNKKIDQLKKAIKNCL